MRCTHRKGTEVNLAQLELKHSCRPNQRNLRTLAVATLFLFTAALAVAQGPSNMQPLPDDPGQAATGGATLQGTVADAKGGMIAHANVAIRNAASGRTVNVTTDGQGHYVANGLTAGAYDITATAPGFSSITRKSVTVSADQSAEVALSLQIAGTSAEVTVDADETHSVAAAYAPMDALLTETSARTEISSAFINNFTSPIADYGEIVGMAPSTFTTSSDGVGLGQSKTIFRGFPDGDYDIDFDGIPFYDTNSPTHHSWAFFPAQAIGGVDFDRSPGTASTIGPTPFGGSIHLLSKDLSPLDNVRVAFSGGSFNTFLYDAQYDSGSFGPEHKLNLTMDVHHMQSHGFQTLNNQNQNAGDIKFEYRFSNKTVITGYSGVIWVDANTPNFSATRCQMYGVSATNAYSCTLAGGPGGLYPYTGAGINFLLTNNSDPLLYLDTQYNFYHVPTDFEYVGVHKELGHNFILDFKGYTYDYDNSEKYSNATTITEASTINGSKSYEGLTVAPCNVAVTKKGVTAIPCGVDKYNSYRKYGETGEISQVSKWGTFRTGMWYEWAKTNRHQYPSDPLNNWADQVLPNFAEKFNTNSYQPFAEFQFHATSKLTVTPGIKFAYYTIATQQFADDGKTIGNLGTGNPNSFITNGGSYFATLPSGTANYRIKGNWSAYFQVAAGSVVPPSSVFDYAQSTTPGAAFVPVVQLPKQQKNLTYQTGTVFKLKYVTFDADYFHIHFDNSYSCVLNTGAGDDETCFAQPPSVTQGVEFESNISLTHGLGVYVNDSYNQATYVGSQAVSCNTGTGCTTSTPQYSFTAPSGLWVQQTPSNMETEGITYQHAGWDASFFDKRIGQQYIDNGAYHNQFLVPAFNLANAFINYTLRTGGRFDQTKIRLSVNNLLNSSALTNISLANSTTASTPISANGTTYTNPFTWASLPAINGQDNVSILAGRSIMLSVTFGLSPKKR